MILYEIKKPHTQMDMTHQRKKFMKYIFNYNIRICTIFLINYFENGKN